MDTDDNPIYDAYYAAKFASQEIGQTQGGKNVSQGAFFIYELYTTAKGRIWVAWSKDGSTRGLTFSGTLPKAAYNTFGYLVGCKIYHGYRICSCLPGMGPIKSIKTYPREP